MAKIEPVRKIRNLEDGFSGEFSNVADCWSGGQVE